MTTFVDPDRTLVKRLGLEHLPAFVFLRQDTTVGAATEGWDPAEWQRGGQGGRQGHAWSVPDVAPPGEAIPTPSGGWKV